MPSANINATYHEMSDTATRMRNNKTDIDEKLNDCINIVNNLTTSGFVTEQASGKFDQVHNDFNRSAQQAMDTLDQLSLWLDKTVEALRDMDTTLAGSLPS
jgi:WXG100 family type VII secretion target